MSISYRFACRRRTAASWVTNNDVLLSGEVGYETDTDKFKIGDGVTAWNSISTYFTKAAGGTWGSITGTLSAQTDLNSALALKAPLASPTFTGTVSGITAAMVGAPSGSGTSTGSNTGDQTNITGNAATVTTNANLTGHVTSVGNAAVLGSFTVAQLNTAISDADVATGGGTATGTNTGDQTNITGNAATVTTNANLTGHVTSVGNAAVLGSFTVAELNTAISDANVATGGGTATGTNTGDQDLSSYATTSAVAAAYQPLDADLTAIAALSPSNDDILQRKAGAWTNRTMAQLATDLGAPSLSSANTWTALQTFSLEDAGTTTVLYPAKFTRTSSGTPANGIGVGCQFEVETTAGNNEIGATISAEATDVTSTSEDFALVFKTMVAGSTTLVEGGRFVGAQFRVAAGSAGAPSLTSTADTDCGLYWTGSDLGFSCGGTYIFSINSTQVVLNKLLTGSGIQPVQSVLRTVTNKTATGAAAANDCFNILTNSGAAGAITLTMDSLGAGHNYNFVDNNAGANRLTVKPNTADQIIWTDGTVISAATGSAVSTARYNSFTGVAVDTTTFVVLSATGTWTITA